MCNALPSFQHFLLLRLVQVTKQVDELRLVICKSNTFDNSELLVNNEWFYPLLLLQIITMQVCVFSLPHMLWVTPKKTLSELHNCTWWASSGVHTCAALIPFWLLWVAPECQTACSPAVYCLPAASCGRELYERCSTGVKPVRQLCGPITDGRNYTRGARPLFPCRKQAVEEVGSLWCHKGLNPSAWAGVCLTLPT